MNKYFINIKKDVTNVYVQDGDNFNQIEIENHFDIPNVIRHDLVDNMLNIDYDTKLDRFQRFQVFTLDSFSAGMQLEFQYKFCAFLYNICNDIEEKDSSEKEIFIIFSFIVDEVLMKYDMKKLTDFILYSFKTNEGFNISKIHCLYKNMLVSGLLSFDANSQKNNLLYIDEEMIVYSTVDKKGKNANDGYYPWNNKNNIRDNHFIEYLNREGIELHDELIKNIVGYISFILKDQNDEIVLDICDEQIQVSCKTIKDSKEELYVLYFDSMTKCVQKMNKDFTYYFDIEDPIIVNKFNNDEIFKTVKKSDKIDLDLIFKYASIVVENSTLVNVVKAKNNPYLQKTLFSDYIFCLAKFYYKNNRKKFEEIKKSLGF